MDADMVREFTCAAGNSVPRLPRAMTTTEVDFLSKMILDEVMELMATVHSAEESKALLRGMIDGARDLPKSQGSGVALIAEQADALVDAYYYSLNAACKVGVNLSHVFRVVHRANMAKRDPSSGAFIKNAEGKILKPPNWQAPDIAQEIKRQILEGAWESYDD